MTIADNNAPLYVCIRANYLSKHSPRLSVANKYPFDIGNVGGTCLSRCYFSSLVIKVKSLKWLIIGTTPVMEPHPRQQDPLNGKYGTAQHWAFPLKWKTGEDAANIKSLLMASYNNTSVFLGVGDGRTGRYNVGLGRYESNSGQPLAKQGLELIAQDARRAFRNYQTTTTEQSSAAVIGRATVERALYIGSILRESGSARGIGLLAEHAGQRAAGGIEKTKSFYSQHAQTPAQSGVLSKWDSIKEWTGDVLIDKASVLLGSIPMNYLPDFAKKCMYAVHLSI